MNIKIKLVFLLSFTLLSCVSAPPDVPICVTVDSNSGFCVHTISDKEYDVVGNEWELMKNESLVLPAESWLKLKQYILEMCFEFKNCPEIEKKIEKLEVK